MRYLIRISFLVFILGMFIGQLRGQCAFQGSVDIKDLDTISIPILVSGAVNNDLSSNNGLKAVAVHFKHEYVSDLSIELVSPSGQIVQLVGPIDNFPAYTGLVTCWNVEFFASSLPAFPDPGYDSVWNSLQIWLGFKTYVGKYHPHQGMLEDFNTGPVNGLWTLNIIDGIQFGSGKVFCFDLTFCDEEGVDLQTCSLLEHNIDEPSEEFCTGSPELDLVITPEIDGDLDESVYGYGFLLFKDGLYQSYLSDPDMSTALAGNYSICGIEYFLSDLDQINSLAPGLSKQEMIDFLISEGLCASISEDCKELVINKTPPVLTLARTICAGDVLIINGVEYSETGFYNITTPLSPCDSMSILNLTVLDLFVDIQTDTPILTCANPTSILDASATNIPGFGKMIWTTVDGRITSDPDSTKVEIDRPGTYVFEVKLNSCKFSREVVIEESEDFVEVTVNANAITCLHDSIFIDLNVSDTLAMLEWTGPGAFEIFDEDIRVGLGGTYSFDLTTIYGCQVKRDIIVMDDRIFPIADIISDTLTCKIPTGLIYKADSDELGSTFQWFNQQGNLSTDTFLYVTEAGNYSLEITTELGCKDTFNTTVQTEIDEFDVILYSDTVNCVTPQVQIAYSSSFSNLNSIWTLPNNAMKVDSSFTTSQAGNFLLNLSNSKGCFLDTMLTVIKDNDIPEVNIFDAAFFCGDDSIQLFSEVNFSDVVYKWTTPSGVIDTNSVPTIFNPGMYILEVCRPNGCCDSDTVIVSTDQQIPTISFETGNLDCNTDTVFIIPSDTSSYLMNWRLNNIPFTPDSNIIMVTAPGVYAVVVTDAVNGCKSTFAFNILQDNISVLQNLSANILTCEDVTSRILTSALADFESFEWTGPGLLDLSLQPMVNLPGTYYIDFTFTNGCSGRDSIEILQVAEMPNLQANDQTIDCFDEVVNLEVNYSSSSIALNWVGPGTFTANGSSVNTSIPGIYTVYGLAAGSCRDTLQIEVFADTLRPVVSLLSDGDITCSDSLVQLLGTVDATTNTFDFFGPGIVSETNLVANVNTPGIYRLLATGFNGCKSEATVQVNNSTDFPVYQIIKDSITCIQTEASVGITSPDLSLSVFWSGPIQIPDDTYNFITPDAGTYTFSLTNEFGCELTDSFVVVRDTFAPNASIVLSNQITCAKATATLQLSSVLPSWSITWSGPGVVNPNVSSFSTSMVGDYNVILEGPNGCITEDLVSLEFDTAAAEIMIIGEPITCSAGKTFLRVESDLNLTSFNWTGPSGFTSTKAEPLIFEQGIYVVDVIALNGCTTTDTIFVEDERQFPSIEVSDFYLPCDGAPVTVFYDMLSTGASVLWFGPDNFFANSDTTLATVEGMYIGIAINEEGCTFSDTFQILDVAILPEFSGISDVLLCLGPIEITALDVDDDRSVMWEGPNGYISTANPALTDVPGIYHLIVTGDNGCIDSMDLEVLDGRIYPEAVADLTEAFQCLRTEVNLNGTGSSEGDEFIYAWTTSNGSILQGSHTLFPRINSVGTYIIEVKNTIIGCSSFDTILVELQEQDLQGIDAELVAPTCAEYDNAQININEIIGGFGPFNVIVDGADYGERLNIQYLTAGEHHVMITDDYGCKLDTILVIPIDGILDVQLPADTIFCFGDSLTIFSNINLPLDSIASIKWSDNIPCNGCTEVTIFPKKNMTVTIEVIDINGCIVEDEFVITVDRPNKLPFPQIFSPNGDDINDVFYMPMTKGLENIDQIRIYDNWGGVLYEKFDLQPGDASNGWDGRVNGQNAEIAIYLVDAMVTLVDGSKVRYVGDVMLVR